MSQDVKSFLHEWCSKNKFDPKFEVRPTGKRHIEKSLTIPRLQMKIFQVPSIANASCARFGFKDSPTSGPEIRRTRRTPKRMEPEIS